jgi:hypothetical protein
MENDREIIKLNSDGCCYSLDIPVNHGFINTHLSKRLPNNYHDIFTAAGIITSPGNSENVFFNNRTNQYYIFNGWESDEFGLMSKNAKHINLINVTDLIK